MTDFAGAVASNRLSPLHGDSPIERGPKLPEKRIVLIYFAFAETGVSAKQYYYDLHDAQPGQEHLRTHEDVIRAVIAAKGGGNVSQPGKPKPFPEAFDRGASVVNFGWQPCHVVYILDDPNYTLQQSDNDGNEKSLNQPVVFRESKIVKEGGGYVKKSYKKNRTFYNLRTEDRGDASLIRFDNIIRGPDDVLLGGRPADPRDQEAKKDEYCMDMHIEIRQNRKTILGDDALPDVTIIFDPPQSNGGTGGPPD